MTKTLMFQYLLLNQSRTLAYEMVLPTFRMGLLSLVYYLRTSAHMCPEVCVPGDSKSNQTDNED